MRIKTKLYLGFAMLLLLLVANSATDWMLMDNVSRITRQAGLIDLAKESAQDSSISTLRFVLYKTPDYSQKTHEHLLSGLYIMGSTIQYITAPDQMIRANAVLEEFVSALDLFKKLEICINSNETMGPGPSTDSCNVEEVQDEMRHLLMQLVDQIKDMAAFSVGRLETLQTQVKFVSVAISLLALLLGIGIMLAILQSITRPVASAMQFAESVASGNFDTHWQYDAKDEMGRIATALNTAFTRVVEQACWYESILDSIPNVISVTDMDMRWTFLNKAALAMLDAPRRTLLNQHCSRLGSPVCGTEACGIMRLRNDPVMHTAHTLFCCNDRVFAAECSYLTASNNTHIGHVTFLRDVTEDERLRLKAEEASRAKSAFLSTMSHEIRTPINAIVGFTHLFERDNLNPAQLDKLSKIHAAASVLLDLVNDVLMIAANESGKLELATAPFNLEELLQCIETTLSESAHHKGLRFTIRVGDQVPAWLMGDEQRLRQVLLNLLGNAVKFTPTGDIALSVDLAGADHTPHTSTSLVFSVIDTGIGIRPEQMSQLFTPFSQLDSSIGRRFGGTGLGLYVSRQLVEAMGGHMDVTSHVGQGTTFRVLLPCHPAAPEATQEKSAASPEPVPVPHPACPGQQGICAGLQALVVEDNEINQEIAVALLESCGLRVTVAANGQEALDRVRETRFDAIFMDMQMPVMDGLEATRQLRVLGSLPVQEETGNGETLVWLRHVPIIAMTANALAEDRQRCLGAGMDDYISKPIDPECLQQCLQKWISRQ